MNTKVLYLRIPSRVHDRIVDEAAARGMSITTFTRLLLDEALDHLRPTDRLRLMADDQEPR